MKDKNRNNVGGKKGMGENMDHTRRRKSQNKRETTMNILKGKRNYCSNETTAKSLKQTNKHSKNVNLPESR